MNVITRESRSMLRLTMAHGVASTTDHFKTLILGNVGHNRSLMERSEKSGLLRIRKIVGLFKNTSSKLLNEDNQNSFICEMNEMRLNSLFFGRPKINISLKELCPLRISIQIIMTLNRLFSKENLQVCQKV